MTIQTGVGTTLVYKLETTLGVKPAATSPTAKTVRRVSGIPTITAAQITSNELRPDRMTASMRQGQRSIATDIAGELSIGSWDDWIEMAMCGTWASDQIKIGKVKRSMSIEAGFADIAKYQVFSGIRVSRMALSVQPNAIVTCTFGLMGLNGEAISSTQYFTTPTAPSATQAMTGTGGSLTIGGTPVAISTGLDLTLDNSLNAPAVIGANVAPDILLGRAMLSGNVTALFSDETLVNAFLNETNTVISMLLTDPDSAPDSTMTLTVEKARFSGASVEAQGDTGALVRIPFTGLVDAASATSLQINRSIGTYT